MTSVTDADRDNYNMINFEETELRLGLPGAGDHVEVPVKSSCGKRGFSETGNMDLKLNLSSTNDSASSSSTIATNKGIEKTSTPSIATAPPRAKAQVVGWPPVRSFRKNIVNVQKSNNESEAEKSTSGGGGGNGAFVKVSMDGAPYLRKVDLKLYKSYQELSDALAKIMFVQSCKRLRIMKGSEAIGLAPRAVEKCKNRS
ncbi:hypothetical protein TSUD_34170 [Trifolium subterraneum]|uniref:Auxin-induced protein n=1 Tax=Trifolium subterraneum TaxID=3900 RepID=A0A2Z6MF96_TRISU|nr:hypothetical protein TSUD_34170 [Trifolium subterraneum]